jgi:hypothetical protein
MNNYNNNNKIKIEMRRKGEILAMEMPRAMEMLLNIRKRFFLN